MLLRPKNLRKDTIYINPTFFKLEDSNHPTMIYYNYITNDNVGFIAISDLEHFDSFEPILEIGYCKRISSAFDVKIRKTSDNTYDYYNYGIPYILWIDENNNLKLKYNEESVLMISQENVTECCICRGWYNLIDREQDQGFLIVYIKENRVFCGSFLNNTFSPKGEITNFKGIPLSVSCTRTLDYRVAFVINTTEGSFLYTTNRCWAGTALPTETVFVNQSTSISTTASFSVVKNMNVNNEEKVLISQISKAEILSVSSSSNQLLSSYDQIKAYNTDGFTIILDISKFNIPLWTVSQLNQYISVKDKYGLPITILDYKYEGTKLLCSTTNFNNARELIKVVVKEGLPTIDNSNTSMFCEFTPTNLVPFETNPPKVISITNEEVNL